MKLKIIKLNFTSPLHIGSGKPDHYDKSESVLHSDTIKSAVFSTALLFKNDLGEDFFRSFTVSSALPYYKEKLFFHVPDLPGDIISNRFNITFDCGNENEKTDYDKGKIAKKIKFLEKSLYEKFIAGEVINIEIREKDKDYQQLISGYLLADFEKVKDFKISKSEEQQRVYVSRIAEVLASEEKHPKFSDPYYVDKIYFHDEAGLYFLMDSDDKHFDVIFKALELLQDFGFGTDRNIGNGQFEMTVEDFELETPRQAELSTNLSLYIPSENELKKLNAFHDKDNKLFYSLVERGGYISNFLDQDYGTLLKNPVTMFGENSVFPSVELKGEVTDVTPVKMDKHKVWRDGTSIFIPLNVKTYGK